MTFLDYISGLPAYLEREWSDLLELTFEHLLVVLVTIVLATVIALGLGLATYRNRNGARAVLTVTGTFLTVPSFALFGLFIPIFGLGAVPTVVALVLYSLLPIARNTITGLRSVDPAIVESAQGMGLSRRQRLLRIELPLAWPVIMTGVRVSTLMIVGIAAIAAIVNGPGLGGPIFQGLSAIGTQRGFNLAFSGTLFVAMLALLLDGVLGLISKLTTSKGL
ncbi:osmoprotectant transport system permease protein [Micromonospora coriariae]|uniref:Osmoprotectant transport system permease protein n=1 Tax=Micromonospora coriariae TaxID=285665 RepID=A0A1C4U528_9ACTN|nr:ABC transporter permease [Micromonospora coriariae]SCE66825.1 osmoprotectant transport system permease protein [Micromonospora coriariae]